MGVLPKYTSSERGNWAVRLLIGQEKANNQPHRASRNYRKYLIQGILTDWFTG